MCNSSFQRIVSKLVNNKRLYRLFSSNENCSVLRPNFDEFSKNNSQIESNDGIFDEPSTEYLSTIAPYQRASFNLAAYVDKSEHLQKLVKLGVKLDKFDLKPDVAKFILSLDFEKDVQPRLLFLHDLGVPTEVFGDYLTKSPLFLRENLNDLETRVNYLSFKKFSKAAITRIILKNPYWLLFQTERIDRRLGFFQKHFNLKGNDVRQLTVTQPKIITYNLQHIRLNDFAIKEEMGFSNEQSALLLKVPRLWMMENRKVLETYDYLVHVMKLSNEDIMRFPQVLLCRKSRLEKRHLFLKHLKRDQYCNKKENYVSPIRLVSGTDGNFCIDVAKSSISSYNSFCKTI